jgi:membrane peptidoglycan carboxypeptidase
MTRAYATIANDGKRIDGSLMGNLPRVVDSVKTRRSGKVRQNAPVAHAVVPAAQAETLTAILEDVVREGTGTRAQIPGREVAGKTGTTDDYGDAWFVGYTPELAVAVWVGYPDALRPMQTEFHGEPVAGGTLPAEIWKAFMTRALDGQDPESFRHAPYLPAYDLRVVHRGGRWQLDNGYCPGTRLTSYFVGEAPATTAKCYANEVTVPVVVGRSAESAKVALQSVPLTPDLVYVPAKPRSRPGQVVKQEPRGGYLSANGRVRLFVSLAQNGLVPNLVGSSLPDARQLTKKLRLAVHVRYTQGGPSGTVLRQSLEPGIAVRPGLPITLLVGDGSTS